MQFASEELQQAWRTVGNPNNAYYPDAVQLLIDSRDHLPAPFVVQMDFVGEVTDPRWQSLVAPTAPLCLCGSRRYVLPAGDCVPFAAAGKPVRLQAGELLNLTLWGGDTLATMIRLSLSEQGLLVERMPFTDELQLAFFDFLQPLGDELFPLEPLKMIVGEKPQLLAVVLASQDMVPACTVTGVEDDAVTVQLHAGIMRPERRPLHQCV